MEESKTKDEFTNHYLDLNTFTDTQFIDFIFFYYRQNIHSYFIASFTANTNFRLLLYTGWIFITVENTHHHLTEFLESQKYAMHSYGSKSSVYAFYADNKELVVGDFDILKDVWRLVRHITRIEIESHNITFRRFSPQSLEVLCLNTIQAHKLKPNLPPSVLLKLGFIEF